MSNDEHGGDSEVTGLDALEAGHRSCVRLWQSSQWVEAGKVAMPFVMRWLGVPGLSVQSRDRICDVFWIATDCAGRDSWDDRFGQLNPDALLALDALISWLRQQPEPSFRQREARILCERMRWYRMRDEEVESLEELVGLLTDLDDLAVSKEMAELLVGRLAVLLEIPGADVDLYLQEIVEGASEGDLKLPDPDEIGVTERTVTRMARIVEALAEFADCLDVEDDPDAAQLRASILFGELDALAKLGNQDRLQSLYDQLAGLGAAAIAACDVRIAWASDAAEKNVQNGTRTLAAALMGKAGILFEQGDRVAALTSFTEIIERFEGQDDPALSAIVGQARELERYVRDLLDEDQ